MKNGNSVDEVEWRWDVRRDFRVGVSKLGEFLGLFYSWEGLIILEKEFVLEEHNISSKINKLSRWQSSSSKNSTF